MNVRNYLRWLCVLFVFGLAACATHMTLKELDIDSHTYGKDNGTPIEAVLVMPLALAASKSVVENTFKRPDLDPSMQRNYKVIEKDPLESLLQDKDFENVYHPDVYLLLHMNNLDFTDKSTLANIVRERFKERQVSNPYANMSDEQIFTEIRSRFVQTPSELHAYLDFVDKNLSETQAKIDLAKDSESE